MSSVSSALAQITPDKWALAIFSAVLGTILGLVARTLLEWIGRAMTTFRELRPIRALLGGLARNEEECIIVWKWMYPGDQDRMGPYVSELPDFEAARRNDPFEHWRNIPFVVPSVDALAATEIVGLLGQLGKKQNIEFLSVREAADIRNKNIICVGGHFKTDLVVNLHSQPLAYWNPQVRPQGGFSFPATQRHFPVINKDYGLIIRTTDPDTKKTCLVVMGGGVLGTAAAAYYFRRNASRLGSVFRKNDFAFLVSVKAGQDISFAEPAYFSTPPWHGKLLGYWTWRKIRDCLK